MTYEFLGTHYTQTIELRLIFKFKKAKNSKAEIKLLPFDEVFS